MRGSFVCMMTLMALSPAALAASRGHKNRCNDAAREIRGGTQMMYANRDVEPKEVQNAISHINQHTDRYNRAKGMLDSAGPWDSSDPELAECAELLDKEKAYIESTIAKIKNAQEAGTKQAPVLAAANGEQQKRAFYSLATVAVQPKARLFDNMKPAEAKALVDTLAPVEEACKSAMPEAFAKPPTMPTQNGGGLEYRTAGFALPGTLQDRADWWCWISSHRGELSARALGNLTVLAERYGNHHMTFPEIIKAGSSWRGSTMGWVLDVYRDEKPFMTGLRAAVGEWYKAFGVPVPEQPFPGLAEQITAVRAAVDGAASRNKIEPTPYHEKSMEAGAKAAAAKLYPKVSTPTAWMDADNWTIEQNALGIPLKRYRSGQVVYRVASDPFCLQRTFNYVEPHMGGGKYQAQKEASLLEGVTIVKCP
jgi:hypothetical protein